MSCENAPRCVSPALSVEPGEARFRGDEFDQKEDERLVRLDIMMVIRVPHATANRELRMTDAKSHLTKANAHGGQFRDGVLVEFQMHDVGLRSASI